MRKYLMLVFFSFLSSCTTVNSRFTRSVAEVTNSNEASANSEDYADIIKWAERVERNMPYIVAKENGRKYYHGTYLEKPQGSCAIHVGLPDFVSFGFTDSKVGNPPLIVDFDLQALDPINGMRVGNKVEFRQKVTSGAETNDYYLSIQLDENDQTLKVVGSRNGKSATCIFSEVPTS